MTKEGVILIDLFAGVGGFSVAANWLGWHVGIVCEIEDFNQHVLKFYHPEAYHHKDIKTLTKEIIEYELKKRFGEDYYDRYFVFVTGGFPCQPFSTAGKRAGDADYRYLWPEMYSVIEASGAHGVIAENVSGILSMEDHQSPEIFLKVGGNGIARTSEIDTYSAIYVRQAKMLLDKICKDLEKGYSVQPLSITAASVGGPHKRERIWIIAYTNKGNDIGTPGQYAKKSRKERVSKRNKVRKPTEPDTVFGTTTNTDKKGLQGLPNHRVFRKEGPWENEQSTRLLRPDWHDFPRESPLLGGNDGVPKELSGITVPSWIINASQAYGNAIVPQAAYEIMKAFDITFQKYYNYGNSTSTAR